MVGWSDGICGTAVWVMLMSAVLAVGREKFMMSLSLLGSCDLL